MLYRFTWFCIMSNIGYLAASPGFTWDTKRDVPRSAVGKSGPRRAQRSWREQHQKNNQMPPEGNGRFTQLAGIEALVHKNAKVEIYLFQLDSFGAIVSHVSPSNWQHRDKWFSSIENQPGMSTFGTKSNCDTSDIQVIYMATAALLRCNTLGVASTKHWPKALMTDGLYLNADLLKSPT